VGDSCRRTVPYMYLKNNAPRLSDGVYFYLVHGSQVKEKPMNQRKLSNINRECM
jgi:hypothetical protein